MGTNYYLTNAPCPTCGHKEEGLHIGKSSAGWQFLFADAPGCSSWREWRALLSRRENRDRILDEYGETVPFADFVSNVENRPPGSWTAFTAPTSALGADAPDRHERLDAEGYRFSKHCDFS